MTHSEPTIVLRSSESLLEFARAGRWLGSQGVLVLDLPDVDAHEQARAQKRFNFWRKVCGCQIGALVFIGTVVWSVTSAEQWSAGTVVRDGGYALGAALIGKLLAIALARVFLVLDMVSFAHRVAGPLPDAQRR